jgi:hypothetical protein
MEQADLKVALRMLGAAIWKYFRSSQGRWYKAGSISFAVHLLVMPIVFFFILRFEKPQPDEPVFMLSGGLRVVHSEGGDDEELDDEDLALLDDEAGDEDWEDDEELEDDEDMAIEEEVLKRLAEEREDIFSLPSSGSHTVAYIDIDEEDEDEEDDIDILDDLADEDDEDEENDVDQDESEPETELAGAETTPAGEGEKAKEVPSWEDIFAKKGGKKVAVEGSKPAKKSKADLKIESLMEQNPYSDDAPSPPAAQGFVMGSFFGEGESQLPDLLLWLPSDIKMAGLISLSLLRSRPDREVFETTFQKLPYFDSIAGGSDLDFFQQLDAVLIATQNPFDVKETYLMLRHNQDEKMIRKAVSRHFAALGVKENWYRVSGVDVVQPSKKNFDKIPWIYFFPQDKVVGIVHISKRDSIKTLMQVPGSQSAVESSTHLIGPLERLMRFGANMPEAAQEDGRMLPPGIVVGSVQFDELLEELNKQKKFPLPVETMVVGRFGEQNISVEGTARFTDLKDPERFISRWNTMVDPIRKHKIVKILGIDKILDFPVWKEGENGSMTLQALVPPERVEPLLALIRLITGAEKATVEKHAPPKKQQKKSQ